jgi:putative ATP-dependent endonuclease of OLD family
MAKISKITVDQYRSVKHAEIAFEENAPLLIMGENNAGKSNLIKAIELVLGEFYPKNHEPEENEFYFRDPSKRITIQIDFSENLGRFQTLKWIYDPSNSEEPVSFVGIDEYGNENKYIKSDERSELVCIVVGADRRLAYQLSYSSKSTMLSKLMHRFYKAMQTDQSIKSALETKFAEIKNEFQKIEQFKIFRESLRADFADLVSSMSHKLDVDFEAYNPVNFFHALRLHADEDGEPRTLEELGTGEEQILALAFAHAYAKAFHGGVLLAIEEPESHLHPLAQEWLAKKIETMCLDGMQIILTTHSPAFINMLHFGNLVLVRKDSSGTFTIQKSKTQLVGYCREHGVPKNRVSEESIGEFYSANATKQILEGFFARKIVLVEGPTESLSLPLYLEAVGLDTKREGIVIIPVQGKGNIAKWWRLFTAFEIPVYVIFDNDTDDDESGVKRRDILNTIGTTNNDGLLGVTDIQIDDKFAIFGKDYETCMRNLFDCYSEYESQAQELIDSGAKPFTARFVARKLADNGVTGNGWNKIQELAEKIKNLEITKDESVEAPPEEPL